MAHNISDQEEEEIHFSNVITTFRNYAQYTLAANNRRRKDIYRLPLADQQVLETLGYKQKLDQVDDAIRANAEFLSKIVANPEIFGHEMQAEDEGADPGEDATQSQSGNEGAERGLTSGAQSNLHESVSFSQRADLVHAEPAHSHSHSHSHSAHSSHEHGHSHGSHGQRRKYKPTDFDMDKLRSTLKQFVRDWSEQGREEREACYQPMKDALIEHFSHIPIEQRSNLRVLVPGAGLGRLAFDVANLGFACQGNEFSHYMLLSSFLILNNLSARALKFEIGYASYLLPARTDAINKYTLYPYVHSFSNALSRQAMLQPVRIPDVLPSSLPPGSDFSLVAGDFEEIYGVETDPDEPQSGEWDAILTCFFIDTAKNIVNYLRIIHRILAPGGVWVNLG
ncbi:hypothetical protein H0H92_003963 [Tricholoma furcatifolium]|nr:hypothetical protein H0H92_003963 [Tricholoma furcatifolium]